MLLPLLAPRLLLFLFLNVFSIKVPHISDTPARDLISFHQSNHRFGGDT